MQKTVYIHIGAPKTGTTAIESFFALNRNSLRKNGYLYPGYGLDHHEIANEINDTKKNKGDLLHRNSNTLRVLREIQNTECHSIIISSDWFYSMGGAIKLKQTMEQMLGKLFIVKIIFYGRRQDHAFQSAYQQMVKPCSRKPLTIPISEFLLDKNRLRQWDYYHKLQEWEEAFGKDAIIVRVYEKKQFYKDDLIRDFLHIIGLELTEKFQLPTEKQSNISLGPDAIEFMRLVNLEIENREVKTFLLKSLESIDKKQVWVPFSLVSPHERLDIITFFSESNQNVARKYLDRNDGKLFYEPLPDPDEPWVQYEGLTIEKIVPIFSLMLFNLDKKYQNQMREKRGVNLKGKVKHQIKKFGARIGLLPTMQYWYNRFYRS